MNYSFTRVSQNKKTGPIPVTMTGADSCPDACPLKDGGCYAENGPVSWSWRKVSDGRRGYSLSELCADVSKLPRGQVWRHNVAGDIPGKGNRIAFRQLSQLVAANKKARANGFTFTHKPLTPSNLSAIRSAIADGFVINISTNAVEELDAVPKDLPVVTLLPENAPKVTRTRAGLRVVACPAEQNERVTCSNCGGGRPLCQRADRSYAIGFRVHGVQKKKAQLIATSGPVI